MTALRPNPSQWRAVWAAAALSLLLFGCFDEPGSDTTPEVFADDFRGVAYQAFLGSKVDAISRDVIEKHAGVASLRVEVPSPGSGSGTYAGGAFVAEQIRDLSGFDALTFWAKASTQITLDVAGLGNDNTGTSKHDASRGAIPVGTEWRKVVLPLPLPEKLSAEKGLFFFAAAPQGTPASGYTLWLDEIRFEALGAEVLGARRPLIETRTLIREVGDPIVLGGNQVRFTVDGEEVSMNASAEYFNFSSSNTAVATFRDSPRGVAVGPGTAEVTGRLGDTEAEGVVTLKVEEVPRPTVAAPSPPARGGSEVISLFSGAYTHVTVDTWLAEYSQAGALLEVTVEGDAIKKYEKLTFAGVEFVGTPIDASGMSAFHIDVWTPDATRLELKLVDFGADGVFGGGDDSEHAVVFDSASQPPLTRGQWMSLELPLADFTGLTARAHLAQLLIAGTESTVYVDNLYFHK